MNPNERRLYNTEVLVSEQSGAIWEADLDGGNARKIATTPLPLGLFFTSK
jgi:hypothetical protein